jgi:uncharacterized protein (TIGR02271 family)
MAKTIVGLFETSPEAEQVVQDLATMGVRREDIRMITNRGGESITEAGADRTRGTAVGTVGGVMSALTEIGVPDAEAQEYTEGVRQGRALVTATVEEPMVERAVDIMTRSEAMHRDERAAQGRPRGGTGEAPQTGLDVPAEATRARAATPPQEQTSPRRTAEGDITVPVVEEALQVGTRQVQRGGVRLYTRVTERPVEETVRLREETVHVERRPVDRPASDADVAAAQERTVEVTETDEEPVVRKQARVVEEVVVSKDVQEQTETIRDTVRRTEVEVEPTGTAPARDVRGFETFETDFRHHYTTTFTSGAQGQAYERWAPAYRYGYDLASDRQYAGRDWAALEPEARRRWEAQQKGTWEEFKDTIRYAWDTVRGRR